MTNEALTPWPFPEGLRVTPVGMLLLRNIAMPFDRYLRERPPAQATYSRTV